VLAVGDSADDIVGEIDEAEERELAEQITPAAGQPAPDSVDGAAHGEEL
jgi:hypothetical protein